MIAQLAANAEEMALLKNLEAVTQEIVPVPIGLNLWKVQNVYFSMLQSVLPSYRQRARTGDEHAREWIEHFLGLGHHLQFAVDSLKNEIEHESGGEHRRAA